MYTIKVVKFGVSNLFFSKVIKEKPLRGSDQPPLVQEELIPTSPLFVIKDFICVCVMEGSV